MKTHHLLLLAGLVGTHSWGVENPIPAPLPSDRYAAMGDKSPFALATPVAAPVTPQASFAANWFVSGIARVGDSDFVSIKARDLSTQFSLFGHEPTNGVSVASVNWSETVGKSTVILQKGSETAKLEFNEADVRGPQQAATPVPQPPPLGASPAGIPGGIPQPPRPAGMPPIPGNIPRPVNPPVIMPPQAGKQFPTPSSNPNEVHRRVRIINQPK